jgi:hypothetical protein
VTQYQLTGPCTLNIDLVEKLWDHRFVMYDYENQFQFVKFLRRGSQCCEIKCDISTEQATEIIERLNLERKTEMSPTIGCWRKAGMSGLDMRKNHKNK